MSKCHFLTDKGCRILKFTRCDNCSFFKTTEEFIESDRKSKERLKRIGVPIRRVNND